MLFMRCDDYVAPMEPGTIYTRADLASVFGVGRSTARYHLDRATERGDINKQWGWTGTKPGWLYALPCTMPRLEGM